MPEEPRKLNANKVNDLLSLKPFIPPVYHSFYDQLKADSLDTDEVLPDEDAILDSSECKSEVGDEMITPVSRITARQSKTGYRKNKSLLSTRKGQRRKKTNEESPSSDCQQTVHRTANEKQYSADKLTTDSSTALNQFTPSRAGLMSPHASDDDVTHWPLQDVLNLNSFIVEPLPVSRELSSSACELSLNSLSPDKSMAKLSRATVARSKKRPAAALEVESTMLAKKSSGITCRRKKLTSVNSSGHDDSSSITSMSAANEDISSIDTSLVVPSPVLRFTGGRRNKSLRVGNNENSLQISTLTGHTGFNKRRQTGVVNPIMTSTPSGHFTRQRRLYMNFY